MPCCCKTGVNAKKYPHLDQRRHSAYYYDRNGIFTPIQDECHPMVTSSPSKTLKSSTENQKPKKRTAVRTGSPDLHLSRQSPTTSSGNYQQTNNLDESLTTAEYDRKMRNLMKRSQSAGAGLQQSLKHQEHEMLYQQHYQSRGEPFGTVRVTLRRRPGDTLGIGIAGGADKPYPPVVSCIKAGSIAHRVDRLMVGDRLMAVNGIKVDNLRHGDIYTLLRNAGETVQLDFEYSLNEAYFERPKTAGCKVSDIVLEKESDSYGITLRGGSYGPDKRKSRPITITNIRPGGPGDREGRLRVGDRLVSIDGVDVFNATLPTAQQLLANTSEAVTITVEYDVSVIEAVRQAIGPLLLEIDKAAGVALGIKLQMCQSTNGQQHVHISDVQEASIADRCGALHVGDQVLGIEGVSVEYTTEAEASQLLRGHPQSDKIKLEVIPIGAADNLLAQQHLQNNNKNSNHKNKERQSKIDQQKLSRSSSARKSMSKKMNSKSKSPEKVPNGASLKPPTIGQSVNRKSSMKQNKRENGHLPNGQMQNGSPGMSQRAQSQDRHDTQSQSQSTDPHNVHPSMTNSMIVQTNTNQPFARHSQNSGAYDQIDSNIQHRQNGGGDSQNGTLNSAASVPSLLHARVADAINKQRHLNVDTAGNQDEQSTTVRSRSYDGRKTLNHAQSRESSVTASVSGAPCGQVCHSEVMEVVLHGYGKGGYGIVLHRQPHVDTTNQHLQPPLFISYIERGSPADKCGVLQIGDRVLAINDWCTSDGTTDDANHKLRHSNSPLTLTVEFDVIETVLPASGVFTVKLAKRGQNLGIVITGAQQNQKGEPVLINEIRTGSVAHRCGSLSTSDRLLSIDNIPLDACTVEEAVRLLHRGGDIVKLRVRKCGHEDDASVASNTIVYSVELSRRGGPLGITIASTDEVGDPILISQLANGGLAERTGALHVGDRLLAINGHSLEGRRVTEAMQLLASCQDKVKLKIAHQMMMIGDVQKRDKMNPQLRQRRQQTQSFADNRVSDASSGVGNNHCKMSTPVQSIDSAVESLEECSPLSDVQQSQHQQQAHYATINKTTQPYSEQLSVQVQRVTGIDTREIHQHPILNKLNLHEASSAHSIPTNHSQTQHNEIASTSTTSDPQSSNISCGDSGLGSSERGTGAHADPFCHCVCQQQGSSAANNDAKEDWVRVLEALETVGESEMLRRLEDSILGGRVPMCSHGPSCRPAGSTYETSHAVTAATVNTQRAAVNKNNALPTPTISSGTFPNMSMTNTILRHPYSTNKPPNHNQTNRDSSASLTDSDRSSEPQHASPAGHRRQPAPVPPPKPPYPVTSTAQSTTPVLQLKSYGDILKLPDVAPNNNDSISLSSATSTSGAQTLTSRSSAGSCDEYQVTLHKDASHNDFGFSVSDGLLDKGVYINKIKPGGPAALNGRIRPLDKILTVNNQSLDNLDCIVAVPLLLSASNQLHLTMRRRQIAECTIEEEEDDTDEDTDHAQLLMMKDSAV